MLFTPKQLKISLFSAMIFAVVSMPAVYKLTNKVLPTFDESSNCPTVLGLGVHAVVFYILTYLSMMKSPVPNQLKVKFSLISTVVFVVLSNPMTYKLVSGVVGGRALASSKGCPTMMGIGVHAAVYTLVLLLLMKYD